MEDIAPEDVQSAGIGGICGCEITEDIPLPLPTSIEAKSYTNNENKIEKAETIQNSQKSLVFVENFKPINIESIRNSGPPIFISISSLLI